MPSEKVPMPYNRKRRLSDKAVLTIDPSSPAPIKRRKIESQPEHWMPPRRFWDNLSRVWLTPLALCEFDRRTVWPAIPIPPDPSRKENINPALLKRFARRGGPNLGDLRAYPDAETTVPSNPSRDSSQSGSRNRAKSGRGSDMPAKIKKICAYDSNFKQHLIDHGIEINDEPVLEPNNWAEINSRISQRRLSLSSSSFSEDAFRDFRRTARGALTEATVMSKVFPIITGPTCISQSENLLFGNLEDLTDGSMKKAQPDFYDGTRPAELNMKIREDLDTYIVPSANTAAPCLPSFFAEGKGPKGTADVNLRQALYDGALGARGIHELQSYMYPEKVFDNNAYTIISTLDHNGLLTIYATHPTPSENPTDPPRYHMNQLRSFAMTDSPDTFRQGATALRNAREWAKTKREEFIAAANSRVASSINETSGHGLAAFERRE